MARFLLLATLLSISIPQLFISGVISRTFTIANECNYTVWPGIAKTSGTAELSTTGFTLQNGESKNLTLPPSWSGRIWGRTLCAQNSTGQFSCVTGDCGSGKLECAGRFAALPTSLAEFGLNLAGGQDFYDVSIVNGFNLPLMIVPQGGTGGKCNSTGCDADLNGACPNELKVTVNGTESVGCRTPCDAIGASLYCCMGEYNSRSTCKPTLYSQLFKNACPTAYSYPYDDDGVNLFTCGSSPDYLVTFCPPPSKTSSETLGPTSPTFGPISPPNTGQAGSNGKKRVMIVVSSVFLAGMLLLGLGLTMYIWRKKKKKLSSQGKDGHNMKKGYTTEDQELPIFDLATVVNATNNFSINNKLGQGGFGPVYKGVLEDGKEIAVKKLSKNSTQGLDEFKNEIRHINKLQHRNLVKLLGCCIQVDETMLIYEFMPNKSLDFFIFDHTKSILLDWPKRFHIISGIAQGLLYLHRDSRLRIIHRDLKAGNILLDNEMNPKISDFGLSRSFGGNETEANTNRVVGTYGYMSPEYASDGLYSTKSDVFSFGVLLLEIVSGKKNRGFDHPDHNLNLIGHAWKLHMEGRSLELIDASIGASFNPSKILRSIHVGLLCVQQCPEDRPSMSSVVLMLGSDGALPSPKQPGFFTERNLVEANSSSNKRESCSANEVTITQLEAR